MKKKVVIIDDNQAFCGAMEFLLEEIKDFELHIYQSAICFLKDYSNNWTGILLIDLLMPGIDGMTLLEELKKRQNKMTIIVISGHADFATADKVKKLGANEFLTKPFNTDLLLEKLFIL